MLKQGLVLATFAVATAWMSPAHARYMQSDPIGLKGGVSTYAAVNNSPLNYIDPSGLSALVIAGARRSDSFNVMGHVGDAITGAGMYSYGNDTNIGADPTAYINSQAQYRDQLITYIPTTPQQDAAMLKFYSQFPGKNSVGYFDNCAVRTTLALRAAGLPVPDAPFPGELSGAVGNLPNAQQWFIPQGGAIPPSLQKVLPSFQKN